MRRVSGLLSIVLVVVLGRELLPAEPATGTEQTWQRAPQAIRDVLDAPLAPRVSVAPTRDRLLLVESLRYPPISDLAQPMLRLAGRRINPNTNGPHRPPRYVSLAVQDVADGTQRQVAVPPEPNLGFPAWSPDGRRFAFTNTTGDAVELWIGDAATGAARRVPDLRINAAWGDPFQWMPGSGRLLCQSVPAGRGDPPVPPSQPRGPNVQESSGRSGPVRTYQDLLKTPHDEELFDYYATSQLVLVDVDDLRVTPVGRPAIVASCDPAPDGRRLLVVTTHRPYSYLHPAGDFPKNVEVWDLDGNVEFQVASLPLADRVPIGGVPTGPRNSRWQPTAPATLVWVEALDEGDPRNTVAHRDRVRMLQAPFDAEPVELVRTEHRFAGLTWTADGGRALVSDYDRDRRWSRTFLLDVGRPGEPGRLVWDRSVLDRYGDPGTPLLRTLDTGHRVLWQHGESIFLSGAGAAPAGARPFLDRFDLATLENQRLFQCDELCYESVVGLAADDGSRFITRYEAPNDPPNYFLRTSDGGRQPLTEFPDPAPQLRQVRKELVTYERSDGVGLSFTLYLPPGYEAGQRLPTIVWAYPREYTDPDTAGQVSGSPHGFTTIGGASHLFLLLEGYAILDGTTMPVVGDPETVNDTYVEQIVASAQAAIDKAVELGVTDRDRVGLGGHSYGAFMTANLLAHSDLFRAGVARSGAYNRTLTPFGFQSERRTLWEAPETYLRMSPFLAAHQIDEPLLLIHGEADDNSGTFPIQSERMYQAIRGNGGTARLVMLPHESHGYVARESVEHALAETIAWFDRHVKQAPPRQPVAAADRASQDLPGDGPAAGVRDRQIDWIALEAVARDELRRTNTPGAAIAVVIGDRVAYANGFGVASAETRAPVTPDMLFRLGSTTKMFTAAAVVSLAEQEKLAMHEPVGQHLDGLHPAIGALTPHALLTHTAGLTDESRMSGLHDESALAAGVRAMDDTWCFTEPGCLYSYANPGYWIAGLLCEQIAGRPYADVLDERLFQPLGMTRTTLRPLAAMTWPLALGHEVRGGRPAVIRPQADNAATWPAGQVYSSASELARFVIVFMNGGQLEGSQPLSPAVIEQLTAPHVERPGSDDHYGYGLAISEFRGTRLWHHGGSRSGYGSTIRMAPEHKAAVIILTNRSGSSLPRTAIRALELILPPGPEPRPGTEAAEAPEPQPEPPSESRELSQAELSRLAGVYTNHRRTVELVVREGKLFMQDRGPSSSRNRAVELVKVAEHRLAPAPRAGAETPASRTVYAVVPDGDGRLAYLCISGRALKRAGVDELERSAASGDEPE